jgi:hypothetical protein
VCWRQPTNAVVTLPDTDKWESVGPYHHPAAKACSLLRGGDRRFRWGWIGGPKFAELLFFLLGLFLKVPLTFFELIVWFWQFVILLRVEVMVRQIQNLSAKRDRRHALVHKGNDFPALSPGSR